MIVNPDKFQVIIIDKKKGDHTNEDVVIDNKQIKTVTSVKLLGSQLNDKLNFSPHISNIYKCCQSVKCFDQTTKAFKFQRKENFNKQLFYG